MYDMTAASLTIPLGTYVKVTNLHNGKAVVVRINDRGPVVEGRIIDLSYQAATVLQFKDRGLQRVRLDLVKQANAAGPRAAYQTVAANHPPLAQLR
jgi:rare lipoprotein A